MVLIGVYDQPLYYEIGFSYQDAKRQADFFEEVAKRFSKVPTRRFLDIACGPSPQLRELARREYEAIGLDINPKMLDHLRLRAREEGVSVETVEANMNDFDLRKKCDFAFLLSGSLYIESNLQFLRHLDCVASALEEGGLYLIENFPFFGPTEGHKEEWTMRKGEIEVRTIFEDKVIDALKQLYEETITLEVNDHGERKTISTSFITKNIAPQELVALIESNGKFVFIGWFEHLKFEPLATIKGDNVVILRRG